MKQLLLHLLFFSCTFIYAETTEEKHFKQAEALQWQETFTPSLEQPWQNHWFLDGEDARVSNTNDYLEVNTQDHQNKTKIFAVLWTQTSFEGDLKIEYHFKKVDQHNKGVNIIYVQATGDDEKGHSEDIALWSEKRNKAAMSDYYQNMHTYHMSYAAYGNSPNIDYKDYIRGRRYLPLANKGLKKTKLTGEYNDTELFNDHQWVKVTLIKKDKEFLVKFEHPNKTQYCRFLNEDKAAIREGRVGLRLMPNRISHFSDFKIYTRP